MTTLHIDIETYSDVDLGKCGVYKYAQGKEFEILLCAFSYDDDPVQLISLAEGESLPDGFVKDLQDPLVTKIAHNAQFERVCLGAYLGVQLDPSQWWCTMIHALEMGLPPSLEKCAKTLGLGEDEQKLAIGKGLIRYFCIPTKSTKIDAKPRHYYYDSPERWTDFKRYNIQDVVTEKAIYHRLLYTPVAKKEIELYALDQQINDYGILVDYDLAKIGSDKGSEHLAEMKAQAAELTGGINIKSVQQVIKWLKESEGAIFTSLRKEEIEKRLATDTSLTDAARLVLELRLESGSSSTTKYDSFMNSICDDNRVHGALQFYGARTGRWAGRLFQPQNLPRNEFEDIELARALMKDGDWDSLDLLYDSTNSVLRTLLRTVIVAPEGKTLAIADYSAIEARVIAWLCDESWRQKVFAEGGDIYCASASAMFGVPVEKHGQNAHLRKKGKVAELALGYGGGPGAMTTMGAKDMGLTNAEIQEIIIKWRKASPKIANFWYELDAAIRRAITTKQLITLQHGLRLFVTGQWLYIDLPSKRRLAYYKPAVTPKDITYQGMTKRVGAWGGKFTENIVQALARDCLAEAMLKINRRYKIVMHIHDEVVVEVDDPSHLEKIEAIMAEPLDWAPGLILTADGFTNDYYRKD